MGDKHKMDLKHMWSDAKKLVKFCSLCEAYRWVPSLFMRVLAVRMTFAVGFPRPSGRRADFCLFLMFQSKKCGGGKNRRWCRKASHSFNFSRKFFKSCSLTGDWLEKCLPLHFISRQKSFRARSCSRNEFLNVVSTYVRRVPHEKFTTSEMRRTKSSVRMY